MKTTLARVLRVCALFLPGGIVRRWRASRDECEDELSPRGGFGNAVFAALPYMVSAILSPRVASDRRVLKYFLPYGFMKKRLLVVFGEMVEGDVSHQAKSLPVRCFRNSLPYGLVLWWDNGGMPTGRSVADVPFVFEPSSLTIPVHDGCARPLVSFVVPVFNVARYLAECLESLRRQSLENIEIICVDDGSTDASGAILRTYAQCDRRFVVIRQTNQGVSAARNHALRVAKGRYVSFVDGDDWLDNRFAEEVAGRMEALDLDMCLFDFECFHYRTHQPMPHFWKLSNHIGAFPQEEVFALRDLAGFEANGSACTILWSREFLVRTAICFSSLKIGEDLCFVLRQLPLAERISVLDKVYYHYRKGCPTSAVSRLGGEDVLAQLEFLRALGALCAKEFSNQSPRAQQVLKARIAHEVIYYGKKSQGVLAWLQREGFRLYNFEAFGEETYGHALWHRLRELKNLPEIPRRVDPLSVLGGLKRREKRFFKHIMSGRRTCTPDLYIVVGQLNSATNEPLDSWTLFQWLQRHGVPCRYVIWRRHKWYDRIKAETNLKDVVVLSGDGVQNLEFVTACADALVRAKAVVMENTALHHTVRRWLYQMPDCSFVFLQHGVTFWKFHEANGRTFALANVVNVASEREKVLLQQRVPPYPVTQTFPRYVVAGLPRFDLLKDERTPLRAGRVVFVMFTWRMTFNRGADSLSGSDYLAGIRRLLSKANLARLAAKGVRIVLAPHHHLVNQISNLDFGVDVELADATEISHWIRHADCCVTDYSSVSFDFVFLHKPTIYWLLDYNDKALCPSDREELHFAKSQAEHFYNCVDSAEAVVEMIERYADKDFALEREKCALGDTFFATRKNVCQTLYEALERTGDADDDA